MTREEAKQWLEAMKSAYALPIETYEAIDMAIEALSADALLKQDIDFHKEVSRIEAEKVVDLEHKLADMVSVVRCKDCRFYWGNLSEDDTDEMYGECRWNSDEMPNADDFCSYGERAEQTEYKLPGHDEVMEALDNLKVEFVVKGEERVKR